MTEEEKIAFFERRKQAIKAYFSKQKQDNEKQFLDLCRIKTQEQFVKECRKEAIPESWYAFTADRSKPVSMDEDTVYYGKIGKSIVSYPFQRWDIAYNELLKYKKNQALAQSGEQYRIDDIQWIAGILARNTSQTTTGAGPMNKIWPLRVGSLITMTNIWPRPSIGEAQVKDET